MIKSLTLKNFQSHEDSTFEFCEGVNVIIGRSDHGKSSAVRALRWVLTNRPTTTSFIRRGTGTVGKRGAAKIGTAEVDIVVHKDGKDVKIVRRRGHELNECTVGDEEFTTLGKDVPELVTEVLNLDEMNIQKQHDRPYLIFETPGAVASTFNKFTNLDKVEGAVSILNSDLKSCVMEKKNLEKDQIELDKEIEKFSYLADFESMVDVYEEIHADINKSEDAVRSIKSIVDEVKDIKDRLEFNKDKLSRLKDVHSKAVVLKKELDTVQKLYLEKVGQKESIAYLVDAIIDGEKSLAVTKEMHLPNMKQEKTLHETLLDIAKDEEKIQGKLSGLTDTVKSIKFAEENIATTKKKLAEKNVSLKEAKEQLEKVDVCITCGQKLVGNAKKTMLENI